LSVTEEEAQILEAGRILETLYDIKTPEFLGRTILLAAGSVLMAFALDFLFLIYWYVFYYGLVTLSITGIAKLAANPSPRLYQLIVAVEAASTFTYLSAPVYLWSQPELTMKFVGAAMMLGAILNSFTLRSNIRAIAAIDMVSNAVMILFIGWHFTGPPELGLARFLGPAIAAMTVGYYAVVLHDIFSLRRKTAFMTARNTEAEKMAAVGRLTGGIAHDFNNILTVVQGNLELSREVPDEIERDTLVDDAQSAAKRASLLTAQLLAFSRRSPLQARCLDIDQIYENIVSQNEPDLPAHVSLNCDFGSEVDTVYADRSQLEAALSNLIQNARDAMPEDGGEILFSVRLACMLKSG